jgi:hypothetical protein
MKPYHHLTLLFLFICNITFAQLLAPIVSGPISPCNDAIVVSGQLPNSEIFIFVNGNKLTSKMVNDSRPATIDLPHQLKAGDAVTAVQKLGNVESLPSGMPIVVQFKPTVMPSLTISHLFGCASSIWLTGAQPGSQILVHQNMIQIGSGSTLDGNAWINLDKNIITGQKIEITQIGCGIQTPITTSVSADNPPHPLHIPIFTLPLIDCQPSVRISDVSEGSHVEVSINGKTDGIWTTPLNSFEYFFNHQVSQGDKITVDQSFPGCVVNDHILDKSPPNETYGQPINQIPTPHLNEPLCDGDVEITVTGLVPGSQFTVYVDNNKYQGTATEYGRIWVPTLRKGSNVSVTQQFCSKESAKSNEVKVGKSNITVTACSIRNPVFECASIVSVTGISIGATVYIESDKHGIISSNNFQAFSGDIGIPVAPVLEANDNIRAVMIACGGAPVKSADNHVQAHSAISIPVIDPLTATSGSTMISVTCIPGAWVEIYDANNNIWLGGAYSGDKSTVDVPLNYATYVYYGEVIRARQIVCNFSSEFGSAVTVVCPPHSHIDNGNCECDADAHYDGKHCVVCSANEHWDGSKCVINQPLTCSLSFVPTNGYVNLGDPLVINWTVANCINCQVSLTAFVSSGGLPYDKQVFNLNNLPSTGSHTYKQTDHFTKYFICASGNGTSCVDSKENQIYIPPATPDPKPCFSCPDCWFYFQLKNSLGWCQMVAYCNKDKKEDIAKQQAQSEWPSYTTIKKIDYLTFVNGCAICSIGTADCDNDASNGCEVNTNTDSKNCGKCGNECPAGTHCENGKCVSN